MGLLDKAKGFFGGGQKSVPHSPKIDWEEQRKAFAHLEKLAGVKLDKLTDYDSYLEAGIGRIWATFRSCDMVANVCATTRYKVCDSNGIEQTSDPVVNKLFLNPNTHETFTELLYLTAFHIKLLGNAYWHKDSTTLGSRSKGIPTEIYPLYPQYVKVIPHAKNKIDKYEYTVNGNTRYFKPDEIIHFKRPNPKDPFLGVGDLEGAEPIYEDFLNNSKVKSKTLERGNLPAGILVRDEFDGDDLEWERSKAAWEAKYVGTRGKGGIAWLTGKWDFIRLAMTAEEEERVESEKKSVKDILLNHGVPASIIGQENAANYATARQDYINFRRFTCLPIVEYIFNRLNDPDEFLKKAHPDWYVKWELDGLLDVEQIVRDYKPLVQVGAMTLNELRVKCGLDEVADPMLDNYYADSNRMTLEAIAQGEEQPLEEIQIPNPAAEYQDDVPPSEEEDESEDEDLEEEEDERGYRAKVDNVPSFIQKNAQRGLDLRAEVGGGSGLTPKTIREARAMARGEITDNKAIRMSAWFLRHEGDLSSESANDYLNGRTERPTAGQIAWLLWGGDLGRSNRMRAQKWAERQANRIRDGKIAINLKRVWSAGEGKYDAEAVSNAKRALTWMKEKKPDYFGSEIVPNIFAKLQVYPICSTIARKNKVSMATMSKIAQMYEIAIKVEGDRYSESVDAMLVDAFGGIDFIKWASHEVPEEFRI